MDPYYIKIIVSLITGIITFIAGLIELRNNRKNWLNRWFFAFFLSSSLTHLVYTIYHFVIINKTITSIGAVITQTFFNFIPISLVMTVFVLEKFPKKAMSVKYLGTMMLVFILMSLGYFILPPQPNQSLFEDRIIDTETCMVWLIIVNIIRMALFCYALFKYIMITKKTEGEAKKRIKLFSIGIIIVIFGLIFNLVGGLRHIYQIEIFALVLFNIGAIIIVKGLLI